MKRLRDIFLIISGVLLIIFSFYNLRHVAKIFPKTFIANIDVSGKSPEEALDLLTKNLQKPEKIVLTTSTNKFELKTADINLNYDYSKSVNRALNLVRTGDIITDFYNRTKLAFYPINLGVFINFDKNALEEFLNDTSQKISKDPVYPSAKFVKNQLVINKGEKGVVLNKDLLKANIEKSLAFFETNEITAPVTEVDPTLTGDEEQKFMLLANKYLDKSLNLKQEYETFTLDQNKLITLLNLKGGFDDEKIKEEVYIIAQKVNRQPQEPKFEFLPAQAGTTSKVTEFLPSKDGVSVKQDELINLLKTNLENLTNSEEKLIAFDIPVAKTPPSVTTDKVNNLGIKELIGRGVSTYYHSIPGRVFNVSHATAKVNGTLVAPGETFSFNSTVGEVSKETGYKEAYIIQSGRTVLGDGGGVCQVSTTLFRAVLNAGLPVEERRAHAYRVGYYEQDSPAGFDATVFIPTTDFKFTNNTNNYILITAKADSKNYSLVFELYGTNDGRVAKVTKPVISNVSAPPPDIYQNDPNLPLGAVKQVDYKAWGAKATFNYSVTKNGVEIYNKTFVSNYKPWANVYLRGTATQ